MQVLHEADVDTKWERNMLMKAARKRERIVDDSKQRPVLLLIYLTHSPFLFIPL